MKLSEIIAVPGMSGLYKTVAQSKNSVIVESLEDKKRMPVYSTQKINTLEAISVYCSDKDIPLAEVFKKIAEKENKGPALDHKSTEADMVKYFGEVLPDYDKERVHVSDIRKMLLWYNTLQKAGMIDLEEEKPAEGAEAEAKVTLPLENAPKNKPQHQKQKQSSLKPHSHAPTVQKQTVRKTGVA